MYLTVVFLLLGLISGLTYAKDFQIGAFSGDSEARCDVNDDGTMTETGWNTDADCVFPLMKGGLGTEQPLKSSPKIKIDGKIISLIEQKGTYKPSSNSVKKYKQTRNYISKDEKIRIKLESWLKHDSCQDKGNEEKCCGQEYAGNLSVTKDGITKVVKVKQWHGM